MFKLRDVLSKLVQLNCFKERGLGADPPASGSYGGLGAKPLAAGKLWKKESYYNAIGSHFERVQSHFEELDY